MTQELKINGMSCPNCVAHVTKALTSLPGVLSAKVDLATGIAWVETEPEANPDFAAALEEEGYDLVAPK